MTIKGSALSFKDKRTKFRSIASSFAVCSIFFSLNVNAAVLVENNAAITLGTEYFSNITYAQSGEEQSVLLRTMLPEYRFKASDGINEWTANALLLLQRSSNADISSGREDPTLNVGWVRALESGSIGLGAVYSKQSSRDQQVLETGEVSFDSTTVTKTLNASWTWNINNLTTLNMDGNYEESRFSGVTSLIDFKSRGLIAVLRYKLNNTINPFVSISNNGFSATALPSVKYQDYKLGATFQLSPTFVVNAGAGFTRVSTTGEKNFTTEITTNYQKARSMFSASAIRTAFPTGIGILQIGNSLIASYDYELTAKSRVGARIGYNENDSNYESQQISGYYNYDFTPHWMLGLSVSHEKLTQTEDGHAKNNTVGLTVTYQPFTR